MKTQRKGRGVALLLLTLALCGTSTQRYALAAIAPPPPGKETRYLLCKKLDGPQGRSGRVRKISPAPGFDPRTFQPVASRYSDDAIPAT